MANNNVYSRSNVRGSASMWTPLPNTFDKHISIVDLGNELVCDGINDFKTTYMEKRIWNPQKNIMTAPLYTDCNYVE